MRAGDGTHHIIFLLLLIVVVVVHRRLLLFATGLRERFETCHLEALLLLSNLLRVRCADLGERRVGRFGRGERIELTCLVVRLLRADER